MAYNATSVLSPDSNVWYSVVQNLTGLFLGCGASDSVNSFNLQPSIANGDTLWQFASPNADGQTVLRPNTCGGKDFGPLYCMNSPVDPTCDTNCSIIYPTLQPCNNNSFAWSTGLSEVFPYPTESVLLAADTASNEFFPLGVLDENEPVGLITTKVDFSDLTEIQWQILSVSDVNDVRWSTVEVNAVISTTATSTAASSSSTTTNDLQTSGSNSTSAVTATGATSKTGTSLPTGTSSPTSISKTSVAATRSTLRFDEFRNLAVGCAFALLVCTIL